MICLASSVEFKKVFTKRRCVLGSLSGERILEGDYHVVATCCNEVPMSIIIAGRIDSLNKARLFLL